jgi:hypothetical protein
VKKSGVGDNAGRGVFAKVAIAEDTYLSAETSSHYVMFMPSTVALIEALEDEPIGDELEVLDFYMHGYGFASRLFVSFAVSRLLHFVCRTQTHRLPVLAVCRVTVKSLWIHLC